MKFKCPYCNMNNDLMYSLTGINIKHIEGPQGVLGRNSDNTKLKKVLKWAPKVTLEQGLIKTYKWIEDEVKKSRA